MQVTLLMACILNAFSFSKWYCTFKTKALLSKENILDMI